MKRWQQRIPARDWGRWWLAYAAHGGTGALAMLLILSGQPVAGCLVTLAVLTRQTVEFLRRNDTPARDIGDHITGMVLGAAGYVAWGIAFSL